MHHWVAVSDPQGRLPTSRTCHVSWWPVAPAFTKSSWVSSSESLLIPSSRYPSNTRHFDVPEPIQVLSYSLAQTVKTGEHRSGGGAVLCRGGVGSAGQGQHRPGRVLRDRHHRNISGQGDLSSLHHHFCKPRVWFFSFFWEPFLITFHLLESEEGDWNWALSGGSGGRQSERTT